MSSIQYLKIITLLLWFVHVLESFNILHWVMNNFDLISELFRLFCWICLSQDIFHSNFRLHLLQIDNNWSST